MENLDSLPENLCDDDDEVVSGKSSGIIMQEKPSFEDTLKKMSLRNKLISYKTNFGKYLEGYDLSNISSLSMTELETLLQEVQIVVETRNSGNMLKFYYIGGIDVVERVAPIVGMNLRGLSEIMKNNDPIQECLNELSIKYDVLSAQPVEARLAFLTLNTILAVNNRNKQTESINKIVEGKVSKTVVDEFKDL